MATYTRADLRDAVLGELGLIDPNEPPSPEDAKLANDRCQQQLEYAYDQGFIWWDLDADTIPARAFVPLSQWIAEKLITPYGALERASILKANADEAEDKLVILAEQAYTGLAQTTDYF